MFLESESITREGIKQGLYPLRAFFNQYYLIHFYFKPKQLAWEYGNYSHWTQPQGSLVWRFRKMLRDLTDLGILERYNKTTFRKVL